MGVENINIKIDPIEMLGAVLSGISPKLIIERDSLAAILKQTTDPVEIQVLQEKIYKVCDEISRKL